MFSDDNSRDSPESLECDIIVTNEKFSTNKNQTLFTIDNILRQNETESCNKIQIINDRENSRTHNCEHSLSSSSISSHIGLLCNSWVDIHTKATLNKKNYLYQGILINFNKAICK